MRRAVPQRGMSMLFDVWLIMHSMTTLIDEALAPVALSGDDFGLYSLLQLAGPTTPSQISRWAGMRPTTVSVALKRLRSRDHSSTTPNAQDGRSYLVGLNDNGVRAHAQAAPHVLEAMSRLAAELEPGQRSERLALRRIDGAFRSVLQLDPRPYDLDDENEIDNSGDGDHGWSLRYTGPALTADQEQATRRYIEFLRTHPG